MTVELFDHEWYGEGLSLTAPNGTVISVVQKKDESAIVMRILSTPEGEEPRETAIQIAEGTLMTMVRLLTLMPGGLYVPGLGTVRGAYPYGDAQAPSAYTEDAP